MIVQVKGLGKNIGTKIILRNINLSLNEGEFLWVFGPNGSGKTTLLNLIAQTTLPTGGKIYIKGIDTSKHSSSIRKNIGYLGHDTLLYDNLTAYENLLFYGRLYDVPDLKNKIKDVISKIGLEISIYENVGKLSRGMKQRLAVARAILHNPDILLLDEPYTGLDQKSVKMLDRILLQYKKNKKTVIMVTHNFEIALKICDKLLLLVNGKKMYEAHREDLTILKLKKLYSHYAEGQI